MTKKLLIALGLIGSCALLVPALSGCKKDKADKAGYPGPAAEGHTPVSPTAPADPGAAGAQSIGQVLETMDSGGYTYAKLGLASKEMWVAGPVTALAVGDQVQLTEGTIQNDFKSPTLDRTFEQIVFVSELPVIGQGGVGAVNPHADTSGHSKPAPVVGAVADPIAKATGGHTIAEVFAQKAALAGKAVIVRGKVVKYNGGIMGRNWVHLQDGTGGAGANDLTFTSDASAKVGDVVVATGTVALDQDFGGGYNYDVIVEAATFTVE